MAIPAQEQRSCSFKHAGLEEEGRKGRDLTEIVCLLYGDFFFFLNKDSGFAPKCRMSPEFGAPSCDCHCSFFSLILL